MNGLKTRQRGNTLLGFIAGLVIGLLIAVAVALFITKAPIPFMNKQQRPDHPDAPPAGKLPDPNQSLYPKAAPVPPAADAAAVPNTAPVPAAPGASVSDPGKGAPVEDRSQVEKPDTSRSDNPDGKASSLQAGAYKTMDDAENMKAKLALLGFEAKVAQGDNNGTPVFRVRLGPYGRIEDLNRVRQRLVENGVDVSVVAPGK